jgi:putative dimethyl sulfoxide reductase chaperone
MSFTEEMEFQTAAVELRFCAACLAEPSAEALEGLAEAEAWQPWLVEPLIELKAVDLEVWQGEHARLFVAPGLAPPFASAHREGMLNGAAASAAEAYYVQQGFVLSPGLPGDYLGSLLECEAWLLDGGRDQDAAAFRQTFLADWLPRFNEQLQKQARLQFYRKFGERLVHLHGALAPPETGRTGAAAH